MLPERRRVHCLAMQRKKKSYKTHKKKDFLNGSMRRRAPATWGDMEMSCDVLYCFHLSSSPFSLCTPPPLPLSLSVPLPLSLSVPKDNYHFRERLAFRCVCIGYLNGTLPVHVCCEITCVNVRRHQIWTQPFFLETIARSSGNRLISI